MARRLDGIDDSLTQAVALSSLITATAGTVACWYRPAGTPANSGTIYANDPVWVDSGNDFGLFRGDTGTGDKIGAYNWDGNADKVEAACTVGTWNHWVWRHGSGTLSLFKDGVSAGSTASGNSGGLTNTLQVGFISGMFLEGDLAELVFWNVALTNGEIAALGKGFPPHMTQTAKPTAYWPIWGFHSPETDLSGNNRNLTVTGTTRANHAPVAPFSRRFWAPMPVESVAAGGYVPYPRREMTGGMLDLGGGLTR